MKPEDNVAEENNVLLVDDVFTLDGDIVDA